jgi:hypothetical protein
MNQDSSVIERVFVLPDDVGGSVVRVFALT